ncbi:MAG: hypothetical protein AB7J30_16575 [Hyphomicrobium sp.]|uniref:hypothetical protein n=1 Tax=Hyphomicrobium sp. TaxID=82 RepID=UPI003D09BF62
MSTGHQATRNGAKKAGGWLLHEIHEMLPPTLFFFVGFNLVLFTKRLLLNEPLFAPSGILLATTSALIVGKTVLITNLMPFVRRYDHPPLIRPILFKTIVYSLMVAAVRLIEALIHYLVDSGALGEGGFLHDLLGEFNWDHFIATQLWIVVLFLTFVTGSEINRHLGKGVLRGLLFGGSAPLRRA